MLPRATQLESFTDIFVDENTQENISQPISWPSSCDFIPESPIKALAANSTKSSRPLKYTGQHGEFRSIEEIDPKYRCLFTYPYFNVVQSRIINDALYSDKSFVLCAPTGSGKTVAFEMAILQLLMQIEDTQYNGDFKIIYMAPVKAVCNERLTEWYPKLTRLGLLCIEVTGDTEVDFSQLKPYKVIITTPEKWDMLTRRWRDHRGLVELIKLFLIDEVHILNDETRGPVLEAVVSRMKTVESAAQSAHRIEQVQKQYQGSSDATEAPPRIRFVAVSATVSNPEDVADWLGTSGKPAVFYKFGDECRPVKLRRVVEGYPCAEGTSIFKFDIILNYKLWAIIQKYYDGKPTLIFCNTRKSVTMTAEALSREITVGFNPEQRAKLTALAATLKNKKLQMLVMSGVGCHHAGLLFEERVNIERAFRNRDLPILITTTTLAMGVNLPAHLVIIKNTQQYVNGAYQEYSISTVLQMVGRAGRPQFDSEATAVIMTRLNDKARYQSLVGGSEPLQSYLHKRIAENLNSEAALCTVTDVAQGVQWLRSTFLYVRAARDPRRYLGLPPAAPINLILKKIEELCVKAMNGLASSGLITMDEACCIESTEAGRLMSLFYLDLETMKNIMKIEGTETLDQLLWVVCESHELSDMHLRMDERRCLNLLNRNQAAPAVRFPLKGKITTRQMKLYCIIQAILGCLPIPEPALNQEAMKVMRIAARVCKCLVKYVTRPDLSQTSKYSAVLNSILLAKCIEAHLWENSPYVSRQLKGIGPTFSTLLASAGLTSFMLLEESHPRDLERIMNKGPPAGNILRKQVSLLPKYQLTATPIDNQTISVQLMLLNHAYLSENIDNLTAGDGHKGYVIVGDSNNHLLLLKPFADKDLINVYDGTMTFEIRRKHSNEHTVMIHCISSQIAGIDAHVEYLFQDLAPPTRCENDYFVCPDQDLSKKKLAKKQSHITDVYKQRKRANTSPHSITQSKEKVKRENVLTEKLKALKESFSRTSKELKKDVDKSTKMSTELLNDIFDNRGTLNCGPTDNLQETIEDNPPTVDLTTNVINASWGEINLNDVGDDFIDDVQIDNILSNIEHEITENTHGGFRNTAVPIMPCSTYNPNVDNIQQTCKTKNINNKANAFTESTSSRFGKRKNVHMKSNFSVIDLIEKKAKTDVEEDLESNDNRFSDIIKGHINKFLGRASDSKQPTRKFNDFLRIDYDTELPEVHFKAPQSTENNVNKQNNTTKSAIAPVINDESNRTKLNTLENRKPYNMYSEAKSPYAAKLDNVITLVENDTTQNMDGNTDRNEIDYHNNNMENNEQFYMTNEDTLPAVYFECQQTTSNDTNLQRAQHNVNTRHDEASVVNSESGQRLNTDSVDSHDRNSELKQSGNDHDKPDNSCIMTVENNAYDQTLRTKISHTINNENEMVLMRHFGKDRHMNKSNLYSTETDKWLHKTENTRLPALLTNTKDQITQNINVQCTTPPNKLSETSTNNIQNRKNNILVCSQLDNKRVNSETSYCKNGKLDEMRVITEINQNLNKTNDDHTTTNKENTLVPFVERSKMSVNIYGRKEHQANTQTTCMIPQLRTQPSIQNYIAIPDRTIDIRSNTVTRYKAPTVNQFSAVNLNTCLLSQANNVPYNAIQRQIITYPQKEKVKLQQNNDNSENAIACIASTGKTHVNSNASLNNNKCVTSYPQIGEINNQRVNSRFDDIETVKTHDVNDILLNKNKYNVDEMVQQQQNNFNSERFIPCFGKKGKTQVNRYSYTATKVDVQTKNTFDHQLRITRKVKLDVDVTEIVTQEKTKINRENAKNERFDQTTNTLNSTLNDNISNILNDEMKILNDISEKDRKLNIKEKDEDCTRNAKQGYTHEKCNTVDKPSNNTPVIRLDQSSSNITNILQKYRTILRKPEIRSTPIVNNFNNKNDGGYTSSVSKNIDPQSNRVTTRRPFRIKDIHTADLPLPDTIIEASTSATPIQPRKILEISMEEINNKNEVTSQNYIEPPQEYDYDIPDNPDPDNNERYSLIELPVPDENLDLDPDETLEDENMLNPKMLLQYFSTDVSDVTLPTDIVAPPAEFTDNPAVYSPTPTQMVHSFYDPVNQYSEGETLDNSNYLDDSYSSRVGTPRVVETWCLPREDESDTKSQHCPPPWIVSRAGSSQIDASKRRLGQFKFIRKKQLRP